MLNGLFGSKDDKSRKFVVMVVSDDAADLAAVAATLESCGHTVYAPQNADEALGLLENAAMPDVLIGDFRNPDTDGTAFVRRLQVRYGKSGLPPVVFLLDSVEDEAAAHRLAVKDILAKPLAVDALTRCLEAAVVKPDVG
ncbi:MAG: response regulator [Chloroflexi bacterium]|nr:response regulator [Chloroflexota bacterium]